MPDKEPSSNLDRRLLYVAAGLGAVVIGVLVLKMTGGGGDDVAVGVVPRATPPVVSTTTTTALSGSALDVAALVPLDPFQQIVTPPAASQFQVAQPGPVTQGTQAKAVPQATSTSTTKARTTTTTSTKATTAPASTTTTLAAGAAASPAMETAPPTGLSVMTGPVPLPGAPLNICVENGARGCTVVTPIATTSVSLLTSATLDSAALRPPTIVLGACSNGQGVASVINSGSNGTVITATVFATVNGSQSAIPVTVGAAVPDQTVIVSACVSPGIGVQIPQAGTQPMLDGLLGTVSNSVAGLLGVLSADSGLLGVRP